jgi:hypothetical protein
MSAQTINESIVRLDAVFKEAIGELNRVNTQKINLLIAARAALPWVHDKEVYRRLELAIEDAEK